MILKVRLKVGLILGAKVKEVIVVVIAVATEFLKLSIMLVLIKIELIIMQI